MTAGRPANPRRRVLVTGAGGFIGRHLVRVLAASGDEVVPLHRLVPPSPDEPVRPVPKGAIVVADFAPATLEAALAGERFDAVFHLAAYGVQPGLRDPSPMIAVNVLASAALAGIAARNGAAFVMAGSWAEYAEDRSGVPVGEDAPLQHMKLYGASKASATLAVSGVTAEAGGRAATLRLFQVYGPGEADYRLVPWLIDRLSAGDEVPLSPGTQRRDFVHVADVVAAFRLAADWALAQPPGTARVFNVASGEGHSVREVAETLCTLMQADPALLKFGALPFRPDDVPVLIGDPRRLREATGWTPHLTLRDGLADVLAAAAKRS